MWQDESGSLKDGQRVVPKMVFGPENILKEIKPVLNERGQFRDLLRSPDFITPADFMEQRSLVQETIEEAVK